MAMESGNLVDVRNARIYPATLTIEGGKIVDIAAAEAESDRFIIPPLIDAHVHIESSMLVPSEFARLAAVHGTVATVSDPHEIANVLGIEGVLYMIENSNRVPFKFYFGAPSCVPATPFETAGAELGVEGVERLLGMKEVKVLSEVMNVPGVISGDPVLEAKIALAKKFGKPIDGHAPGLRGEPLRTYVQAGITTDHETLDHEEALEKLALGMKLLIREGSAAKDFDAFIDLIDTYPAGSMFCCDDQHPDDLTLGHINRLVKRALKLGHDPLKVFRAASLNPVEHYELDVGLLQAGDDADFVVVDNLENLTILKTCIKGQVVAENGEPRMPTIPAATVNRFEATEKTPADFKVEPRGRRIKVIIAYDGLLTTEKTYFVPKIANGNVTSDTDRDILKIVVVNRYQDAAPAVAFVHNFGLKRGALASSVAHDSHNIVAVGVSDEDITRAVNAVIRGRGGLSAAYDDAVEILPLPVAGLMTDSDGYEVAERYARLNRVAGNLGSSLKAPYMTLSFMALLVIPKLKLSDKGLFDAEAFAFTNLFDA
jgi:adenine deaminase